jgi:hypothetical protein
MWSLDVDAPIPQRLAAGLGLGLKASLFIYAGMINLMKNFTYLFTLFS